MAHVTSVFDVRCTSAENGTCWPGVTEVLDGVTATCGGRSSTPSGLLNWMLLLTTYELALMPSNVSTPPGTSGSCGVACDTTMRKRLNATTNVKMSNWKRDMLASPVGSLRSRVRSISWLMTSLRIAKANAATIRRVTHAEARKTYAVACFISMVVSGVGPTPCRCLWYRGREMKAPLRPDR